MVTHRPQELSAPMIYNCLLNRGPVGVRRPAGRTVCGGASRRIAAHGPGGVPQSGEPSAADRAGSDSLAVIYGRTRSENAV
jgi:hypothetical protein